MFQYVIKSIQRKRARRFTKKYPARIDSYSVENYGVVKFANWKNPLVKEKKITSEQVKFFEKFLSKGDFAIDIGANIGLMTVQMSLITGKNGLAIGFDPNPYVFEILNENAGLNPDITNIRIYNYAISDQDGEFYYSSSEASFNNGGISDEKNSRHGKYTLETKIKGINLEKFLKTNYQQQLSNLKLVKIDTEGYDKEIIKSISDLLDEYKPVVITECFGKNSAEARFEQYELLKAKGYSLYYFADFDVNAEFVPITKKEDMLNWKHFDVCAIMES